MEKVAEGQEKARAQDVDYMLLLVLNMGSEQYEQVLQRFLTSRVNEVQKVDAKAERDVDNEFDDGQEERGGGENVEGG